MTQPPIINKVDNTSWLITINHPYEVETDDHWLNPGDYPFMRLVLHESIHFWQAIGIPYTLKLSADTFRGFQRLRAQALQQSPDKPLPLDQLVLDPHSRYFDGLYRYSQRYLDLSGLDLVEGLTRYWDIHLSGVRYALDDLKAKGLISDAEIAAAQAQYGPFFMPDGLHYTHHALRFVFDYERRYNRAYNLAYEQIGAEAFILFPLLAFFALSSGSRSVTNFQVWVFRFADERPFDVSHGNFMQVWTECFARMFDWLTNSVGADVYSSLTVFRHLSRRMMSYSMTSGLAARFGVLNGHTLLETYMQRYWSSMREEYPTVPYDNVELHFHPAFALPGNPQYRQALARLFHPPAIRFNDGGFWVDPLVEQTDIETDLLNFSDLVSAAKVASGEFGSVPTVKCPHTDCPWHRTQLCWNVSRYPSRAEDCVLPNLYRDQLNFDLPVEAGWQPGSHNRPILQEQELFPNEPF